MGQHPPSGDRSWIRATEFSILASRTFYALARKNQTLLAEVVAAPCVADLSDVFNTITDGVYVDDGHLGDFGNSVVAARIAEELEACGIIESIVGTDQ